MQTLDLLVGPRIKRISNALDRRCTLELEDMDLTSTQGMILGYLHRRRPEDVSPGEIGRHFGLAHPTVTGLLQRLEAKGFLTYSEDPTDRRRKCVRLTEKATECHQHIRGRILESEAVLTGTMSPEELSMLLDLLDRMIEAVDAGRPCCCHPKEEAHD